MLGKKFPLWLAPEPLLLASKSTSRRALLAATGLPFESVDAAIDERSIEAPLREKSASPQDIAGYLARQKALSVSQSNPGRFVIGADQVLALDDMIFHKPRDMGEAEAHLKAFSGRTHRLLSAICLARDQTILFEACPEARMTCRIFSENFIMAYLEMAGDIVLQSVGAYQVEALGVHLFSGIEGDHSTILGLPLAPLLAFLRVEGSLLG